jgi:serine beta-lactamase-like protein LACTB, mitochondrial
MRLRPFGCFPLLLLLNARAAAQAPRDREHQQADLQAAVERYMQDHRIPGLSLAVGLGDSVVFARGYGLADLERRDPVTPATVFRLQSTQKLLTAAAVLGLAEAGRLRLDDPVQAYCPAFGVRGWPVTLRELLSHQGGIRQSDLADLFNSRHYGSTDAALRRFARDSLAYEPGTSVVYSNAGYTLLACAMEGATGRPYDSTLAALVLRPAGMRSTAPDNPFEVVPGRARYYVVRTAANTEQWRGLWTDAHLSATRLDQPANADPVDPSWAIGAGSYLGTPADLVRFALALTGGRLLRGTYRDSALAPAMLTATGRPTGRSLGGWLLDPDGRGVPRMLGSTWNGSFALAADSVTGLVVAIASNIEFDQPADLIARVLELWRGSLPSQPAGQGEKTGVVPQWRQPRVDQQVGQHRRAFLVGPLQVAERRVPLPEADVQQREPVGRYVAAGRGPAQRIEDAPRLGGPARGRVGMAQR